MIQMRPLKTGDRESIELVLQSTGAFSSQEIGVALELVDVVLNKTDLSYKFIIAENKNGQLIGYACWGEIPLTQGTYDLYWIAVSPDLQHLGVGRQLISYVEEQVMRDSGRMMLIETSSTKTYKAARAFYKRQGYALESRIRDYYKPGDARLIFGKRFDFFS